MLERRRIMTFRPRYLIAAIAVFTIEVLIAAFVQDQIIRPHIGDVLAVILVYLVLRAVTPLQVWPAVITAFILACLIEFGQLVHVLDAVGLGHNRLARIVFGGAFDLSDFVAYTAGAIIVVVVERTLIPAPKT